jgi:4'-phosphopantetheinyl transferase
VSQDDVHIWLLDPGLIANRDVRQLAVSLLDSDETARWRRFTFDRDRDVFLATRLLARTVLSQHAGLPPRALRFGFSPNGKPELVVPDLQPPLRFNLSNTSGLVACAVAYSRALGIDVEMIHDVPPRVAEAYFAPPELSAWLELDAQARRAAFFAVWTLKESFIKARGDGLSLPLDSFAIALSPPRLLPYGRIGLERAQWQFAQLFPLPSHVLALCVASADRSTIVGHRWLTIDALSALGSEGAVGS